MTIIPYKIRYFFSCLRNVTDLSSAMRFIFRSDIPISFSARVRYVFQIYWVSLNIDCAHTQEEILEVATVTLKMPVATEGVLVEAGCFKGGSTTKFSLLAKIANRSLIVFDSFEGLPDNYDSRQESIFGDIPDFSKGKYFGAYDEVLQNVKHFGVLESCTFIKGWFDDTMPNFNNKIVTGYIDVDLASSTKSCLKYLFPLLQPGGSLYSQDGHLPLVLEVLDDNAFWEHEVGCKKPSMEGLHNKKLVRIIG